MNLIELRKKARAKLDYALYLSRKRLGVVGNPADDVFAECDHLSMLYDKLLLDTSPMRVMFLNGTDTGLGNLREHYVTSLLEAEWMQRPGYDVCKIIEFRNGPKVIKVEVRGVAPYTKGDKWRFWVTDSKGKLHADYVVAVCMVDTYNPCYARMFALPREILLSKVEHNKNGMLLAVSKNKFSRRTGKQNKYWEHLVPEHLHLDVMLRGGHPLVHMPTIEEVKAINCSSSQLSFFS